MEAQFFLIEKLLPVNRGGFDLPHRAAFRRAQFDYRHESAVAGLRF